MVRAFRFGNALWSRQIAAVQPQSNGAKARPARTCPLHKSNPSSRSKNPRQKTHLQRKSVMPPLATMLTSPLLTTPHKLNPSKPSKDLRQKTHLQRKSMTPPLATMLTSPSLTTLHKLNPSRPSKDLRQTTHLQTKSMTP